MTSPPHASSPSPAADTGFPRLLGDVGGTNARFAWQVSAGAALTDVVTCPVDDHASLLQAMQTYLKERDGAPRAAAIGIATPVTGDRVSMTNHPWSFSIEEMRGALSLDRFLVINDFTALALSLVSLGPDSLRRVGGGPGVPGAAVALIGPGTGLGVSGLVQSADGRVTVPLTGEGGHVTLAGVTEREDAVIVQLRRRFGHASAERALSGPGLLNLHRAVCELDGVAVPSWTSAELTDAAREGHDRQAVEARDLFFALLGTTAGNLALSLGARGGVYIGGGIVPRLGDAIHASRFRERFDAKGRFSEYLAPIPVFVIDAEQSPALLGAARALDVL